jgi:hypothetical protein
MSLLLNVFRGLVGPKSNADDASHVDNMQRVFIGYDDRQPLAYHVLNHSIQARASQPTAVTPLVIEALPIARRGLTPFTYTRFLVPWLCNFQGWALFLDLDMLVQGDLSELFNYADPKYAVMVVKNAQRFEWASAMLFNCGHPANAELVPELVDSDEDFAAPHDLRWLDDALVGDLPAEWNHCVGYDSPRIDAKLVHYTQGIPAHPEVAGCEYETEWRAEAELAFATSSWTELMAHSVHSKQQPDGRIVPKLAPDADS